MEQQERDEFVKSSYILMIGYLLSSLISSIGTILVIRFISVEEYYLFNISYSVPAILIACGELGLNYASTYFIAKRMAKNQIKNAWNIIKINLFIKLLLGLLLMFLIFVLANNIAYDIFSLKDERLVLLIQIASVGILSNVLFSAMNAIFLGAQKMKIVQVGTILQTSLRTIFSLFLIQIGFTLTGAMVGFVLAPLFVSFIYLFFLKKTFPISKSEKLRTEWKEFSKMFKYGYPLLIYSIILSIQVPIFTYILTVFGFLNEISYLNTAIVSGAIIGIITKSISFTLFPIFSKKNWDLEQDREKLKKTYQFSIKFATLLVVPLAFFLTLFSKDVFPLIFGDAYVDAAPFISVYFLFYLFTAFGLLTIPAFLNGQNKTRQVLNIEILGLATAVSTGILFIFLFGSIGFFIGMVIGDLGRVIYGNIIIKKHFDNKIFSNLKDVILMLIIAVFIGILVYISSILISPLIISSIELIISLKLIIDLSIIGFFFVIHFILFLILIGLFGLISEEDINLLVSSFKNFPIMNKVIELIGNIEKKIIKLRN